jgi:hypothetical protein
MTLTLSSPLAEVTMAQVCDLPILLALCPLKELWKMTQLFPHFWLTSKTFSHQFKPLQRKPGMVVFTCSLSDSGG